MYREIFLGQVNTVCIVGAGLSGLSAAILANKFHKKVKITDNRKSLPSDVTEELEKIGAEIELGKHSQGFLQGVDLIVLSPGINPKEFVSAYLGRYNIPYVGEVEFSSWFCSCPDIIGITGTNGKTTVSFVVEAILKKNTGRQVHLVGNIGIPFSSKVERINPQDIVVIELSSFQLETIKDFCPRVACLINFSPDHLDRYKDLGEYFQAKKRIFFNQDESCYSVFPAEMAGEFLSVRSKKIKVENSDNISVIKEIVNIYGVNRNTVDGFFKDFKGLPHRLEDVMLKRGVRFINDSKSTTVSSTIYALKKVKEPLILIAGGKDKGLDYSRLRDCRQHIKKLILIGQAKEKIKESLQGFVDIVEESSLGRAVESAYSLAVRGDTVLLSPMCASFDMFKSYEERGDVFKEEVRKLPG